MAGGQGEITCSPWDKRKHFWGIFTCVGYISGAGDVRTIDVDEEHGMANITIREYLTNVTDMENLLPEDEVLLNEQGVIPKRDDVRLSVSEVLTYSRELEERSVLFHRTGGVHCAALVHHGTFLSYKEDISRHVAVDKVLVTVCFENSDEGWNSGLFRTCSGGNPAKSGSHGLFCVDCKVGTDKLFLPAGAAAWDHIDRFCKRWNL